MQPTDEQFAALDLFREGETMVIDAGAGCLAADTVVHLNRGGKGSRATIEWLVAQTTGRAIMTRQLNGQRVEQRSKPWDPKIVTRIAVALGDDIRLGTVASAWCSGEKETYRVRTAGGREIRATTKHPFLTADGWRALGDLAPGMTVLVNSGRSANGAARKRQYRYLATKHHPNQVRDSVSRDRWKVAAHRVVIEAELNGLSLDDYVTALRQDPEACAAFQYLDDTVHVHHRDEDQFNNARTNLEVLPITEHHRHHAAPEHVLWRVGTDEIESINRYGVETTYDIEMIDEPHNYVANGFVVHNTGKTSTLMLLASDTQARGQYLAFNKAIVRDVERKLPPTCAARTAHSLAYATVGKHFRHRLNGDRIRAHDMAKILDVRPMVITYGGQRKDLAAGYLASHVMRGLLKFCQTAAEAPGVEHFPYIDGIDLPDADGKRTYVNNDRLRNALLPALQAAWADVQNVDGRLRYDHAHYLKAWQLRNPKISADYIMFDEAQDASPVMAAIVAAQEHAQCVYVGDRNQAIYRWTGAIDAMEGFESEHRSMLTQSFRFGPDIATEANLVLAQLGSDMTVRGLPSLDSQVGTIDGYPDAVLCRTNGATIARLLDAQLDEHPCHLVGGGKELAAFARAAQALKDGGRTSQHDLACFSTWAEVVEYVDRDPEGAELRLLVGIIEKFGAGVILDAVEDCVPEGPGVLSVSTAHKAKGREWDRVRLDGSMGEYGDSDDELRLRYVAMTRARFQLDLDDFEEGLARAEERARR